MRCSATLSSRALLLLFVGAIALSLSVPQAFAHNPQHAGILFLHFGQKEAPYATALRTAFVDEVTRKFGLTVDFYTDSVDALERGDERSPVHDRALADVLRHRYAAANIHIVVPVSNEAIAFFNAYRKEICPEAQPVYMAMSFGKPPGRPPLLDATGVIVLFDAKATLDTALRQNPNTRHVIVIAGTAGYETLGLSAARDEFLKYGESLDFQYVTGISHPELLARIQKVPRDSVILMLTFSRDAKGDEFIGARVLSEITQKTPAPIYVVYSSAVGYGAVGGVTHDFSEIGRVLGSQAVQVLSGTRAGDIPVQESTFQRPIFDWKQMQRWNIQEKQLPRDSVVLNREPSLWARYHWHIAGAVALFLVQSGLILGLVVARVRKRTAEVELARHVRHEELVAEIAAELVNVPDDVLCEQIEAAFRQLLRLYRLDRISLWEFADDLTTLRLRSVQDGESRTPPPVVHADEIRWLVDKLMAKEAVHAATLDDLPPQALDTRRFLEGLGVKAFAAFPICREQDAEVLGGISFTSLSGGAQWTPEVLQDLQTVADLFTNALERKRAETALSSTKELHACILDSLSSHLAVLDSRGRIIAINKGWSDFWIANSDGKLPPPGLGTNYLDICRRSITTSHDGDYALAGILSVLEGKSPFFEMEYECSSPEEQRWYSMHVTPLLHSRGAVIRHLDVTERRRADLQIRESEARFRLIADTAPVMIWMTGPDKQATFISKAWLQLTGTSIETQVGFGWTAGLHPDDKDRCMRQYEYAFSQRMPFVMEYRLRRHDGQYRWIYVTGIPRFLPNGTFAGYIGGSLDVTEQKESEEARTRLSGLLIGAQEQERARIARELHDHINQRMALLAIGLQQFEHTTESLSSQKKEELQELWQQTNDISHDIQALSHQLHSSQLQHLGLVAALRGLCQEISKAGTHTDFTSTGTPPRVDENTALALFRVAQEALRNVSKYSQARAATVHLDGTDNSVCLTVFDAGVGFAPEAASTGLGLISMRERMRLVGGELLVSSVPGEGTRIVAQVKLVSLPTAVSPEVKGPSRPERRKRARA